jgi:transposase-like protein
LGYEKHDPAGQHSGHTRNGKSRKTLKGDVGEFELKTRRDRQSTFEPQIVAKLQTRWTGFDDKIASVYARGMTICEIQGHLEEIYGMEVSPTLISNFTEAVIEEVKQWQSLALEEFYPIMYLDALMVKMRDVLHFAVAHFVRLRSVPRQPNPEEKEKHPEHPYAPFSFSPCSLIKRTKAVSGMLARRASRG